MTEVNIRLVPRFPGGEHNAPCATQLHACEGILPPLPGGQDAVADNDEDELRKRSNAALKAWEEEMYAVAVNVPSMITEAIWLHRELVAQEEAFYDADGNVTDKAAADAAWAREIKAFRILAKMPCPTAEEAQEKLTYFLEPAATGQYSNYEKLSADAYVDDDHKGNGDTELPELFLRSLLVELPGAKAPGRRMEGA